MDDFIAKNDEIVYQDGVDKEDEDNFDSVINHIQIRNKLNAELEANEDVSSDNINENPEEKEMELVNNNDDNDNDKQKEKELLKELTKTNMNAKMNGNKHKRYFDGFSNDDNNIIMVDDDSDNDDSDDDDESDDESDDDTNDDYMDSSDDEVNRERVKDGLSELSKLEFEKLLSHTMVNLALKLEENDNKNMKQINNPFANQDDQISLETNNELNMKQLLSFISDDIYNENNNNKPKIEGENINDSKDINDPKDFDTIIPFEKSDNILPQPKTSSSNHPSNLRKSKLNNTALSNESNAKNTFIQEEIRLAENTMNKAITRRSNIERKNFAPPLSTLDRRIRKKKKRGNAGRSWFNMPSGKLTPENKMHFLMLKYRHMIYRDYKPTKMKDDYIPQYFQMGTIIEGPTEFYSDRLTKKQRHKTWANEYLSNPTTKAWLEEKTRRAQNRIRKPGSKFWVPMKKLAVNNRYKLRKQILKSRKKKGWNKPKRA